MQPTSKLYISPPWRRPHGFWYVSGPLGCAVGDSFMQTIQRYLALG